jgi:hypothetical protein
VQYIQTLTVFARFFVLYSGLVALFSKIYSTFAVFLRNDFVEKKKCLVLVEITNLKAVHTRHSKRLIAGCLSVRYVQVFGDTYEFAWTATHFFLH